MDSTITMVIPRRYVVLPGFTPSPENKSAGILSTTCVVEKEGVHGLHRTSTFSGST